MDVDFRSLLEVRSSLRECLRCVDEDATDSVRRLDWSAFFRLDEDAEFLLLSDLNMVD